MPEDTEYLSELLTVTDCLYDKIKSVHLHSRRYLKIGSWHLSIFGQRWHMWIRLTDSFVLADASNYVVIPILWCQQ